jgi:GT2 family glycosyltransferase
MQINKISVLIVLYNKKIKDSATIKSVLEIENKRNLSLTIVNNGPEKIDDFPEFQNKNSDFDSIEFHEFLENKSLSKIYNKFINDNLDADYYIIFDDDSIFKPELITNVAESSSDILLPLIISQNDQEIYYPTINGKTIYSEGTTKVSGLMSISSGLTISNHFANLLSKEYGQVFDEHFALYGIDTSFFIRTQRYSNAFNSVSITCQGVFYTHYPGLRTNR